MGSRDIISHRNPRKLLTKDSKEYPLLSNIFSFVPQIVIFSGRSSRVFIGSISKLTVELPSQLEFVLKQFSLKSVEYSLGSTYL